MHAPPCAWRALISHCLCSCRGALLTVCGGGGLRRSEGWFSRIDHVKLADAIAKAEQPPAAHPSQLATPREKLEQLLREEAARASRPNPVVAVAGAVGGAVTGTVGAVGGAIGGTVGAVGDAVSSTVGSVTVRQVLVAPFQPPVPAAPAAASAFAAAASAPVAGVPVGEPVPISDPAEIPRGKAAEEGTAPARGTAAADALYPSPLPPLFVLPSEDDARTRMVAALRHSTWINDGDGLLEIFEIDEPRDGAAASSSPNRPSPRSAAASSSAAAATLSSTRFGTLPMSVDCIDAVKGELVLVTAKFGKHVLTWDPQAETLSEAPADIFDRLMRRPPIVWRRRPVARG